MKILSHRRGANSQLNVVVVVFSYHTSKFATMISRCIYYSESGVKDYFCFRFVVILTILNFYIPISGRGLVGSWKIIATLTKGPMGRKR